MSDQKPRPKSRGFFREQVRPLAIMVLILLAVRSSVADWNDVPSGSMKPSILEGDRIFVNKLAFDLKVPFTTIHLAKWADPKPGNVVVFYSPDQGTRMVKRVIAGPGDTVQLVQNRLIVNGKESEYGALAAATINEIPVLDQQRRLFETETLNGTTHPVIFLKAGGGASRSFDPITLEPGKYFMMGDNRDESSDSRVWGVVDRSQIVGKAVGILWSFDPAKTLTPRGHRWFSGMP